MADGNGSIELTRERAFASGSDAATMRAHQAGRAAWSREEADIAAAKTNKLLLYVPAEKGGLAGFLFTHSMIADLGLSVDDVIRSGNHVAGHNGGPALAEPRS